MNKVELIGNLGCDVETRFTQTGTPVANFRLATHEKWEDKQGESQERTEWHRIVAWGHSAEHCAENLKKGSFVRLTGKNRTRSWNDRNGNKRYTTEVHVHKVELLNKKEEEKADQHNLF
jgi:single-strand DNA-binding protein